MTINKTAILKILDRLYLSFSILVLAFTTIVLCHDVINAEIQRSDSFERAHIGLEKTVKLVRHKNLTIAESRRLRALEAKGPPSSSSQAQDVKKKFDPDHFLIDTACFDYQGNETNSTSPNICTYKIWDFSPGNIASAVAKSIGILLCVALGLYAIRRWAIWVFSPKMEQESM